jgi:uncharacterized protein with PQ loop repeat
MTTALASLLFAMGTAAGIALTVPQIYKILRTKHARGVSLGGLLASFFSWYLWVPYTLSTGDVRATLGLAIPGAVQGIAVLVAYKHHADRTGLRAAFVMVGAVAAAFVVGGWGLYMVALGTTTFWAYGPSILSALRSVDISGISLGAWWMTVLYGLSWLGFGVLSDAGGLVYTGLMNAGLAGVVLGIVHVRVSKQAWAARAAVYADAAWEDPAPALLAPVA